MPDTSPIGIFGGSFDPVHAGHIAIAALAREHLQLDTVYIVPAGNPPHKKKSILATAAQRLAMLRAAVGSMPGVRVCTRETGLPRPSYTLDTVRWFKKKHDGQPVYFIIGSDNLREICTWHRWRELAGEVTWCVVHRPGYPSRRPPFLTGAALCHIPSPEWGISSTMVRAYLGQGHSCTALVPPGAREYIRRHHLYRITSVGHGATPQ